MSLGLMEGGLQYETDHEFYVQYDCPEEVDEDLDFLARGAFGLCWRRVLGVKGFGGGKMKESLVWRISLIK